MSELKTLKDLEDNTNEYDVKDLCNGMVIIEPSVIKQAAREWIKEINKIIGYEWTEEDKEMIPAEFGKVAKGYLKVEKMRKEFREKTGICIDDEYDIVDGVEFIKHFFNLEDKNDK